MIEVQLLSDRAVEQISDLIMGLASLCLIYKIFWSKRDE